MEKRELFFGACDEIGEALKEYGFIPGDYSRGLRKKSVDGVMENRIFFGPLGQFRRESPDPPLIHPYFEMYSTQLGEWIKSQIRNERYSLPDQVYA